MRSSDGAGIGDSGFGIRRARFRDSRTLLTTALLLRIWPLSLVHIRDRHPQLQSQLGEGAFARPSAWGWLLKRGYLSVDDRNLTGLANPARISLLTIIGGLVCAALLWLLAVVIG